MRFALFSALLFAATAAVAAPLTIDYPKSSVTFVSKQMNVPTPGRFKKFTAAIEFDPAKLDTSKATLELDTGSIDAGSAEGTEEAIGKAWLHAAKFPKATFTSTGVKSLGGDRFEISGQLTIKGKTLPVTAPFTVKTQGDRQVYEGAFLIKRLDFGIGDGPWNDPDTVANEVQVKFRILAAPGK